MQAPPSQVSVVVHALPSSQVVPFGLAGLEQIPVAGLQVGTSWHWSCAAQTTGAPAAQTPASQVSVRGHALPSSQVVPLGLAGLEQMPVTGLQVPTSWHWSWAWQATAVPATQAPPSQVSVVVHALPSSHAVPFGLGDSSRCPSPGC